MDRGTLTVRGHTITVRQFEVLVVDGTDRDARACSTSEELTIGTSEGNDLRLTDPAVSRHHLSVRADRRGLRLTDLGSRNGTFLGDAEVVSAYVTSGTRIRLGHTTIAIHILDSELEQSLSSSDRLGALIGASPAMRRLYELIVQCARSTATVLLDGETGTGKELVADAIHEHSGRTGRFVVVDCGSLSHELAESELFGHERGAFTGADAQRIGAFEAANGGTVFLDEIGELPAALQPLLLRVLENRTIRRLGSNQQRELDVRVIAASHRDLRVEVNARRFRPDLFYRLNVVRIVVPPLRDRPGDVALLAAEFWRMFRDADPPAALLLHLETQSWPGNVRELRNAVERSAVLGWASSMPASDIAQPSYQQAKDQLLAAWERTWVRERLAAHGGNLSRAARASHMGRSYLRELARRHGILDTPARGERDSDDET